MRGLALLAAALSLSGAPGALVACADDPCCVVDDDCAAGAACFEGVCALRCESDAMCAEGEVCRTRAEDGEAVDDAVCRAARASASTLSRCSFGER